MEVSVQIKIVPNKKGHMYIYIHMDICKKAWLKLESLLEQGGQVIENFGAYKHDVNKTILLTHIKNWALIIRLIQKMSP